MAPRPPAKKRPQPPAARSKKPKKRRRSLLWRFRRPLFLVALLLVAALSGSGFVLANVPLPPADIPVETTFIYDHEGNKIAELSGGENRESRELRYMSPHLIDAVLSTEDRDFFTHPGIDGPAIVRATIADLRGQPLQGGSTITQQYVKNVYVGNERSIWRKLREATLAVKLERKFNKEEILERYLNTIYFGRGAYGAQAANRAYFNEDVSNLDVNQAAYLAGLIRAPEKADASSGGESAEAQRAEANRRRNVVLDDLVEMGHISTGERDALRAVPVESYVRPRSQVVQDRIYACGCGLERIIEYVRQQLVGRYGDARVNGGGLRVFTTIDIDLQKEAYAAVYERTLDRVDDPAGALVAVDRDGRIRAMVGGREPDPAAPTAWDEVNLATGRAGGGGGRQPGSSFKPFVLATAVAQGYTVESALPSPREIEFPEGDNGRPYNVENYGGASYGRQNLIDATRVSSNTVYAQLIDILGPESVADTAHRLGVTSEITPNLSMALGTPAVSVLDMAASYLTFATRGDQIDPTIITEVTRADGALVDTFNPERERVLQPEQADVVTHVLREVVEDGTGTDADPGVPVAGKTGTTQGNGDAWFVGYTPGLSVAVWMGYPEGQSRQMRNVHGVEAVTGGTLPAAIFRRFMSVALDQEAYRGEEFVEPDGFPGEVLSATGRIVARDEAEEPVEEGETTTTSTATTLPSASTTTTTAPDAPTTTTTAPPASTTTAPPQTTTSSPPATVAVPAGGGGGPSG